MNSSYLVDHRLYEPLDPKEAEIRLLDLLPSTEIASQIVCTLRKLPVMRMATPENEERFEALSYTWGDTTIEGTTILVNQHPFKVTRNLEAFLRRRRETSETVTLWVDAVCINQQDLEEKNHQIPIMNLIYAIAWRCSVWLGPASHDSTRAMQCIMELGSSSPYEKMPLLEERTKLAVQSLLSRSWWTRVWIIQELVLGGLGVKFERLQVCCGEETVSWGSFVVAAARIQAYRDDLRQPFPNISNILELDSLRESAYKYLLPGSPTPPREFNMGLLCRYRHFFATNPRDKLYAVHNIFARLPSEKVPAQYDCSVRDVYLAFALREITTGSQSTLDILRQCGPSANELPSWVPDWSVPLGCAPLPAKRIQRYFDVPWWAEPEEIEPHKMKSDGTIQWSRVRYSFGQPSIGDSESTERQKRTRLRRLEIGAKGFGVVEDFDEIPPNFTFHGIPEDVKGLFKTGLANKLMVLSVSDERRSADDSGFPEGRDCVKEGEIITERRMKRWLLDEIRDSKSRAPYRAAGNAKRDISIDEKCGILKAKGLVVDTVDVCHDPFVDDIDNDWKNTTRFMVAVGHCKEMALDHGSVTTRYEQISEKLEAFWKTLFVGQVIRPGNFEAGEVEGEIKKLRYSDWLPRVPPGWSASDPPITETTTGLVELAEVNLATRLASASLSDPSQSVFADTEVDSLKYPEFTPQDWTDQARERHRLDLAELGSLWGQQPFDLYHRPFSFLHIVPDPYWDTRKTQDAMALQRTKDWKSKALISLPLRSEEQEEEQEGEKEEIKTTVEAFKDFADVHHRIMTETPSMVPQGTLAPGMEKYALGRRFFITKKGRMGLGPKEMMAGDTVAVIFGSDVPFCLRREAAGPGMKAWRLIGECYVQDLMGGEAMKDWELGKVDTRIISIG